MRLNTKFTAIIIMVAIFPIAVLAAILYYNMEQSVIAENISYMSYTAERNRDQIKTNIDSINMTTQFFLSDSGMNDILSMAAEGNKLNTVDMLNFYGNDVASLERLVSNNPLLYTVRIFATNDSVQEMMPILYNSSRMKKLSWYSDENVAGWHYGYFDTTFSNFTNQRESLASLVTYINDYEHGTIGVIEAATTMATMFPGLFENVDNEWSCFVTKSGEFYLGSHDTEENLFTAIDIYNSKLESKENEVYYLKGAKAKWIISYMPIKELKGILISVRDITEDVQVIYDNRNLFVAVMIIILFLLTFLINNIVNGILKQFYAIIEAIEEVQKGDLSVRIKRLSNDEAGELGGQLNTMLDRVQKLMQDNIDREVLAKNSEIRALQNQINAHFIYNVLETIKMMAEIDEKYEISDAITALGKLLRYSMRWVSGNVTVAEELEYIKNYLVLINLRFDYEIYLSLNIPDTFMDQEIPKMSLQPIVENAILHGIEEMAEDTNIYIKGYLDGDDCNIEVTDAGKGMDEKTLEALRQKIAGEIETSGGKGHGIGLKNVQDRITMAFGEGYGVRIDSMEGCYTKVTLHLPVKHR